ncbi:hypothetical protein QAD02_000004 [Eretmocerus hayati]|uniref:Uncharacterized protein n=1 Tax=Eretmocerus hayati TaxID=131215 RepID=A0ACC2NGN4_9HYME|nr:hypothetical protein QAD02_000004 [Eretmocerus hayati]
MTKFGEIDRAFQTLPPIFAWVYRPKEISDSYITQMIELMESYCSNSRHDQYYLADLFYEKAKRECYNHPNGNELMEKFYVKVLNILMPIRSMSDAKDQLLHVTYLKDKFCESVLRSYNESDAWLRLKETEEKMCIQHMRSINSQLQEFNAEIEEIPSSFDQDKLRK